MQNKPRIKISPQDIKLLKVLTSESAYGIVWDAYNRKLQRPCVVKQILLRTKSHYNQDKSCYVNEQGKKDKSVSKLFELDEKKPFMHTLFRKRKSMSLELFKLEIRNAKLLSKLNLGVKIWGSWIKSSNNIEYGFLVTEKGQCTVKDLIIKKAWHESDHKIIDKLISSLHENQIIHRDLKPSNIVVWLKDEHIVKAKFIDFQKVRTLQDLGEKEFKKKLKKEIPHFKEHVKKNKKETK